ncbi:hypothetical protein A6A22_04115 [Arthrobacter sp. OY3WO11]|nr:hypothetical protein A6A22_04115 [Arthrobacter sp. OY3WO11]
MLAEQPIGGSHHGPADTQGFGQGALAGQRSVQGHPAVEHQKAYDVGQLAIARRCPDIPLAQETGKAGGGEG